MAYPHIPVMAPEVIRCLNIRPNKIYVDCTIGGCGHSKLILESDFKGGGLIGLDQDRDAIHNAMHELSAYEANIHLRHSNFDKLPNVLSQLEIPKVDGILVDLGLSYHHLVNSGRGFSFQKDEPLDMRMNIEEPTTAEMIVNTLKVPELERIFRDYGEERFSKKIARKIAQVREKAPLRTSLQLAELVKSVIGNRCASRMTIHPATRVFMALRITVNKELERLKTFMACVGDLLNKEGRLCVISFHSLEDRIVKKGIQQKVTPCTCPPDFPRCVCQRKPEFKWITRKVLRPSETEIKQNPMARSAKLRCAEKLESAS